MSRIQEIDFTKFVMIILMVAFHLVFIGDTYPTAKNIVYAFHMPCFLLISGYVCNYMKDWKGFLRNVAFIFLPYIIMEGAYIYGASILPIREHIDELGVGVFLNHLLVRPLGPYWYLHTLVLCTMVTWCTNALLSKTVRAHKGDIVTFLRPTIAIIAIAALWKTSLISMQSAIFFSSGIMLKACKIDFGNFFSHIFIAIVVAIACYFLAGGLDGFLKWNVAIVYLALCICTIVCRQLQKSNFTGVLSPMLFIGRNTLVILLFSPLFTILSKSFLNATLRIDGTGMLFMCVAVIFSIGGSLLIAWGMTRTRLDRWFPYFGIRA